MAAKTVLISQQHSKPIKILKWKVSEGTALSIGRVILLYDFEEAEKVEQRKLKSTQAGTIRRLVAQEDAIIRPGETLLELAPCIHPTIMKDMCAECGADLRKDDLATAASVPMVHAIPDLKVSEELAQKLGKADGDRLLKDRKLVLLVDLDQTIIHTTNDNIPANIKDVYHFQLYGPSSPWYHTRLRPGTHEFLKNVSDLFELHICTFGARNYAHTITTFLDGDHSYFSNRILSRDECFDPTSKKANLKALFPCGDNMVCIIDDREDVWSHASNLIHVKPYHFFQHTGDINAPPGLAKQENDEQGADWTRMKIKSRKKINGTTAKPKPEEKCTDNDQKVSTTDDSKGNMEESPVEEPKKSTNGNCEDVKAEEKEEKAADEDGKQVSDSTVSSTQENDEDEKTEKKVEEQPETEAQETVEQQNVEIEQSKEISDKTKEESEDNSKEVGEDIKEEPRNKEDDLIEVEDTDDYLKYLEDILKRIHKAFYEAYDRMESGEVPDLKEVIPAVRSTVLKGIKLVFSGLVPTHIKLEQSKAYQVARSLGAIVTQDIEPDTTHLVAVRPGTAKVNAGKRRKKLKIVTPDWLWACAERWEHLEEKIYPLNSKGSRNRHPPSHVSPEHAPNYPVHAAPGARKRTASGRFMDTINPLMSFSSADIEDMDKEVNSMLLDEESDSDDEVKEVAEPVLKKRKEEDSSSSSEDSMTGEYPRGFIRLQQKTAQDQLEEDLEDSSGDDYPSTKFRRGEQLDSDCDIGQDSNSNGSTEAPDEVDDGEWNMMGAALEREFLANN